MVSIDLIYVSISQHIILIIVMIFVLMAFILLIVSIIYYKNNLRESYKKIKNKIYPAILTYDKPSGIKNSSSTCYMNAIVQAVASSSILIEQFHKLRETYKESSNLECFINVLEGVNVPDDSYEHLSKNTSQLERLILLVDWTKTNQQDAYELFAALIKGISDEFKAQNINNFEIPLKLKMVYRFQGYNISDRMQYHLGLSLGLCGNYAKKPGVKLEFLISEHFAPTLIDGDPNKTSQVFFLEDAPMVLLLHIQANKWNATKGTMFKPNYHIIYEHEMILWLDVIPDLCNSNPKRLSVIYNLSAVVQHMGTISGGHYVTYRKWRNEWYLVSDEQVEKIKFNANVCPYILIYEKVRSEE